MERNEIVGLALALAWIPAIGIAKPEKPILPKAPIDYFLEDAGAYLKGGMRKAWKEIKSGRKPEANFNDRGEIGPILP